MVYFHVFKLEKCFFFIGREHSSNMHVPELLRTQPFFRPYAFMPVSWVESTYIESVDVTQNYVPNGCLHGLHMSVVAWLFFSSKDQRSSGSI